ncbi:MAG: hypothetical protein J5706_01240 [Elusimicrobiales bacterium]|nr:hypothetical protein [Elusimicrobiales bacterium]
MPEQLKLTILNPEGAEIADLPINEVIVPSASGFLGIRPGHAPLMSILLKGDIKYVAENGKTETIGIYRGFAEVLDGKVLILAVDKKFADMLELEEEQQAAIKKKHSGKTAGETMNLDEADRLIKRSLDVLNNLRQNAKKQKKGL